MSTKKKKKGKDQKIPLGKRVYVALPGWYKAKLLSALVKVGRGGNKYVDLIFRLADPRYSAELHYFVNFTNRLPQLQEAVSSLLGRDVKDGEEADPNDLVGRLCMVRVEEGNVQADPYQRKIVETAPLDPEDAACADGQQVEAEAAGRIGRTDQPAVRSARPSSRRSAMVKAVSGEESGDE